jgi:hypothetical protein
MAEMYMSTLDDVVHSKYCYFFILGKLFHLITLPYMSGETENPAVYVQSEKDAFLNGNTNNTSHTIELC